MAYKHQITKSSASVRTRGAKKIATVLLASLPLVTLLGTAGVLTGCGFQLRGYDAPLRFDVAKTAIIIEDNRTSFPLKLPLTRRLEALGIDVVDGITMIESAANSATNNTEAEQIASIKIDNIRFQRYELVGVLTEIRIVLSADVTYKTMQNSQPVTLTNPIQVERSYQYNEASVSTDDQQGNQIRDWLYDSLARRITDQYVAISLPKVAPNSAGNPSSSMMSKQAVNKQTTIIAPNP